MPIGDGGTYDRDQFDPTRHPSYVMPRSISIAALRVHSLGLLASVELGQAGHVPDSYLAALAAEQAYGDTTVAVLELSMAGVWRRVDGGYQII
jgi:hypothetical protein